MIGRTLIALALLSMSACATCERHPVACGAALAVIGTSIALSANGSEDFANRIVHTDPAATICQRGQCHD